jgi:hypothetical protein
MNRVIWKVAKQIVRHNFQLFHGSIGGCARTIRTTVEHLIVCVQVCAQQRLIKRIIGIIFPVVTLAYVYPFKTIATVRESRVRHFLPPLSR